MVTWGGEGTWAHWLLATEEQWAMRRADIESVCWNSPEGEWCVLLDPEGGPILLNTQLDAIDDLYLDLIEAEERRWNLWQHIEEEVMFVFIEWWAEDDRGIGRFGGND